MTIGQVTVYHKAQFSRRDTFCLSPVSTDTVNSLRCIQPNIKIMYNKIMKTNHLLILLILGIALGLAACTIYPSTPPTAVPQSTSPETVSSPPVVPSELPAVENNFSKTGAVVSREDGWYIFWDEPGRLALNLKLIFTPQSICLLGGEKKDCGLINMGPQSYDRANVEGNQNNGQLTVTKLEELSLPQ